MGPMFEHCVAGKPEMTVCAFVICAVFLLEPLLVLAQILGFEATNLGRVCSKVQRVARFLLEDNELHITCRANVPVVCFTSFVHLIYTILFASSRCE
uniref:Pancreatic trypsin inhibitor n=1 Tax=Rhipicephalus appendiculatus TaxID=34631 RepID=A0A131YAA0_RHIAP